MTVDHLHASYILRLRQRLSRLTFELRDVRTGQTRRFGSTKELSSFLDAAVAGSAAGPTLHQPEGDCAWNALGTTDRQPANKGERK